MTRFATLGGAALATLLVLASTSPVAAAPDKTAPKTTMTASMATPPAPAMSTPAPVPVPMAQATGRAAAPVPKAAPADTGAHLGPDTKLSAKQQWDRRHRKGRGNDHRLTSIFVPISFFLCILLLVGTIQYIGLRKDRNRHHTLQLMVEKGAQIPVELITNAKRRGSDLKRGLVLIGTGVGIGLFLLMTKDARQSGAWGLGLIPAFIGAGYLLAHKLEGHKNGNGGDAGQPYVNGGGTPAHTPPPTNNGEANG